MKEEKSFLIIYKKILEIYQHSSNKKTVVLVGGQACSGKTTLSNKLKESFLDNKIMCKIISLDNWIISLDKRTGKETVKERFAYEKISDSVSNYLEGQEISTSAYNSRSRKTSLEKYIVKTINSGIIIIEGVVALDISNLRNISNLKIFVETNEDIRIKRFFDLHLNVKNLNNESAEKIYYERLVDEIPFIESSKKFSNVVYQT